MEKTKDFIFLHAGSSFAEQRLKDGRYANDCTYIDIYELPTADLEPYICLMINGLVDQEFLLKHKDRIQSFLDQGKVLHFGGICSVPGCLVARASFPKQLAAIRTMKSLSTSHIRYSKV